MTTVPERLPGDRPRPAHGTPFRWPWLTGLDRGGLITGVLGLLLGGLYLMPAPEEGRAVSTATGGQIPCALLRGQPMGLCPFSLQRHGPGEALLQVTHDNGVQRDLVFEGDSFQGCQPDREGCGALRVQGSQEGELKLLRIGNERYEVPGTLLRGK